MSTRVLLSSILSAAALVSAAATANPSCPILTCDSEVSYAIQVGLTNDDCDLSLKRCTSAKTSPPDVRLECYPDPAGHVCEAWPQGEDVGYVWWPSSGLALIEPALGPQQIVACQPGSSGAQVLAVEVTSPFGLAASAQVALDCP